MVLVTAAMREELAAFDDLVIPFRKIMENDGGSPCGRVQDDLKQLSSKETEAERAYAAAVIGTGKVLSALSMQRLLDTGLFDLVVHVGICGGCRPDMPAGSLIFPEWTIQHDLDVRRFGFARGQIPYTSMCRIQLDEQLQKRLSACAGLPVQEDDMQYSSRKAGSSGEQLFFGGGLLSGDEFLTAVRKQELLKEFSDIDVSCADMEGFSVSAAAHLHGLPCGMVRAVSDDLGGRRPKNFRAFLQRQSFRFRQMIETFCASASD